MHDITQSIGEHETIRFTANSNNADNWMQVHYGSIDINLSIEDAKDFKADAEERGLIIKPF